MTLAKGRIFGHQYYYDYKRKVLVNKIIAFPDDLHFHVIRVGIPDEDGKVHTEEELIKLADEWNKIVRQQTQEALANAQKAQDGDQLRRSTGDSTNPPCGGSPPGRLRRALSWAAESIRGLGKCLVRRDGER